MFTRWKDFPQDPIIERLFGWVGPNLFMSDGEHWARQRRLVAPTLNEKISKTVWGESQDQAVAMLDHLMANPGADVILGLRTLAMNVLAQSGYAQKIDWTTDQFNITGDSKVQDQYFWTVWICLQKQVEVGLLPTWFLQLPIMPKSWRQAGHAVKQLPILSQRILDEERRSESKRANFLSMLVKQSDEGKSGGDGLFLTEDEIGGNLMVFTSAGFETTSNTMGLAIVLLAANPDCQEWMREVLTQLPSDVRSWQYEEIFPKCNRILAVMFETLRLFTPSLRSSRSVNMQQSIQSQGISHHLSAPMIVNVNLQAIHNSTDLYPDPTVFQPTRWLEEDSLVTPRRGTFVPWISGPRQCPGMKMAQVEFVTTFATLFRNARCEAIKEAGETQEQATARMNQVLKEAEQGATMQVKDPSKVKLRWIRTDSSG